MTNNYCRILGIEVPSFEKVARHREANTYARLIVALLEHGEPMTLAEVAERFARVGIAPAPVALSSLKRCQPARAPVYRDGDLYALDPHDDELDLWAFRLGLRPPKVSPPPPPPQPPEVPPLPGPEVPLTVAELEEAWADGCVWSWSDHRVAVCVLDARGEPLSPDEVAAFLTRQGHQRNISAESARYWRFGTPIRFLDDGRWALDQQHPALFSARKAVRDRLALVRRWAANYPDPVVIAAHRRAIDELHAAHAAELARLQRVLVHAFPRKNPALVVLLDIATREITTWTAEELPRVHERLGDYDLIAAVEVRELLRSLAFDAGDRRLAELGPPQKSMTLNRRGRTLKITTPLLVSGSCGIGRRFGDEKRLRRYLVTGELAKLRRRLEADAKALFALYQYGRLHGAVRLRWGFLDEMIPAPWVDPAETTLYGLKRLARELGAPLEAVIGGAPGWADPWSRARRLRVESDGSPYGLILITDDEFVVDDRDLQLARLAATVH